MNKKEWNNPTLNKLGVSNTEDITNVNKFFSVSGHSDDSSSADSNCSSDSSNNFRF